MISRSRALSKGERRYVLLLGIIALYPAVMLLLWIIRAIPFPYGLDYNEGIVWQQMNDIVAGRGYGPIDGFPAIVYHYPPAYHLLSAAVAAVGVDPLSAGRIVSLLATVGSAVLIALLARTWLVEGFSRMQRIVGIAGAVLCFLGCRGVQDWAPLMRVDPLACFFALSGLWLAIRAVERPKLIYAAALAFVLSVFSKQNSVLTAIAGFGVLLFWRPKMAVRGVIASVVIGSAALAVLLWQTAGEAWKHLLLYNINRFDLARLGPNLWEGTGPADRLLLALGILGILLSLRRGEVRAAPSSSAARTVARQATLAFAALATVSLISTAKYGSSSAYYMQWEAALSIFGGVGAARMLALSQRFRSSGQGGAAVLLASLPVLIVFWVAIMTGTQNLRHIKHFGKQGDRLSALIQPIRGPILSTEMALLLRNHRPVVWEPAIFRELAHAGRWDERILVEKIRRHEIAAVITDGDRGYRWFDEQFSPAIADAMDAALPYHIHVGRRILRLPGPPRDVDGLRQTPMPVAPRTSPAA
jgi:hypothetical protein